MDIKQTNHNTPKLQISFCCECDGDVKEVEEYVGICQKCGKKFDLGMIYSFMSIFDQKSSRQP